MECVTTCPACGAVEASRLHMHTAGAAAEHFVPRERSADHHDRLVTHLTHLWDADCAEVRLCGECGFAFSSPFIGGDAHFYLLAYGAEAHYPSDRWEFGETISKLHDCPGATRLLEVGAGKGAFIERLRAAEGDRFDVVAADYDQGAVAALRSKGIKAVQGSVGDIQVPRPFDVICLFQTLEHMAPVDDLFRHLHRLITERGSVFVSVPNGAWTTVQEALTGCFDMPPNHVGRWTGPALEAAARRHGFRVVEQRTDAVTLLPWAWRLAVYRVEGNAYAAGTFSQRANAFSYRPLRGALKRTLACAQVPRMLMHRDQFVPTVRWAHLKLETVPRLSVVAEPA